MPSYNLSVNLPKKEIYKRIYEYEKLKETIERMAKYIQIQDVFEDICLAISDENCITSNNKGYCTDCVINHFMNSKNIKDNKYKDLNYYLKLKYPFEITQDEDNNYFLKYPDLSGCITCGSTIEEVIKMGEDAKTEWIKTAIDNNIYIPRPKNS